MQHLQILKYHEKKRGLALSGNVLGCKMHAQLDESFRSIVFDQLFSQF